MRNRILHFGSKRIVSVLVSAMISFTLFQVALAQQDIEHTKYKADQTLRSNARINPSTLAVELTIPIADMPGRGGASMPLVFNYSSKVWELRATGANFGPNGTQAEVRPIYSDLAIAGWRSSYAPPKIDSAPELYDCKGNATSILAALPAGCGTYYFVKKIRVILPGGATHELRKDDLIYSTSTGNPDETGIYLAVDGSRVRLEWGVGGSSTLFMSDGGRYYFDSSKNCTKYTDRNGNVLTYNSGSGAWTDTLGRTLTSPLPFTPAAIAARTPGTQSFAVPGLESSTRQFQLVWKKLSSGALANGYSVAYESTSDCGTNIARSPALFINTTVVRVCSAISSYFDPVVLSEVILPNGQKYTFKYTQYGEIAEINYPTGGYERFVYAKIKGIAWDYSNSYSADSYGQANRGVVDRYVGAGDGAAEQRWQYTADYQSTIYEPFTYTVTTTAPDLTVNKRYLHRAWSPPPGNEFGTYGYDTALSGMERESLSFDSNGALRARKLTEWEVTSGTSPATSAYPERDPRVKREISITFEPGETSALATMSETSFDSQTDPLYFAKQNPVLNKKYHYLAVSATAADHDTLATAIGWFNGAAPAVISETAFLYSSVYKDRNIVGLISESTVKDGAGVPRAKTQFTYDGVSLLNESTSTRWENPNTNYRGLVTKVRTWHDLGSNQFIDTYAQYDPMGNLRYTTDGRGNQSQTVYSATYDYAYPTSVMSPAPQDSGGALYGSTIGLNTSTSYDLTTGLPTSTTDANNQVTSTSYRDPVSLEIDPMLRVRKVTAPNGHQTITEYGAGTNSASRWVKTKTQIDANNWKESYSGYDGLGRPTRVQSVDAQKGDVFVDTAYDAVGRPWKTTNPYRNGEMLYWTTNTFDSAGRPWKVTTPDNAVVETTYSLSTTGEVGTVVTVKDQAFKERRSVTNALGQLKRVDEPSGTSGLGAITSPFQPTSYGYDVLNNLISVTQVGDTTAECGGASNCTQTRTFTYDAMSRLKSANNPESGIINYTYDANGNLATKTDARSISTTYSYDRLNRVTFRDYSDSTPDVSYYYDNLSNAKGTLIKVSTGTGANSSTTEYTSFDILGRVTASKQTTDGVSYGNGSTDCAMTYTYNLSGAMIEQQYPSCRKVRNTLDSTGDLALVQSKKNANSGYWSYADSFSYSAAGALTSMQLGNGRWESTVYNERLQPTQIALGTVKNGTDKLKLNYTYGGTQNNGNVMSQTITVPGVAQPFVQNYTYDELNRLKTATETNSQQAWSQTFTYDRFGNRNITAGTGITGFTFSGNRITAHTYDASGNTLGDGSKTFTYDAENKQTKVNNGGTGEYWYDGDGKRIKKYVPGGETTIFVYDAAGKLVAEYSTVVEPQATAKVAYVTNDHLGSPRIHTDQNGAITARHDYRPFGEEILRTGNGYTADTVRKQFTSYERDNESSLDFAQARYFSSITGRFTSPDNVVNDSYTSNPQTWNSYIYARNSPLVLTDPSGEKADIDAKIDRKNKIVTISVSASIGIWSADGKIKTNLSGKVKSNIENQIRKWAGSAQIEGGYTLNVFVNVSVTAFSSAKSSDDVLKQDDSIQNIIQLTSGPATEQCGGNSCIGDGSDKATIKNPDGTSPDVGTWNYNSAVSDNEPAHEFLHILGRSHVNAEVQGGPGYNSARFSSQMSTANAATLYDYTRAFGEDVTKAISVGRIADGQDRASVRRFPGTNPNIIQTARRTARCCN